MPSSGNVVVRWWYDITITNERVNNLLLLGLLTDIKYAEKLKK